MSVTVHYRCGGCSAEADGTKPIRKEFRSFSGRSYGIGFLVFANSAESVAPEGWVPFDPYTYACYCPECWAEIESTPTPEPKP